MNNKPYFQIRCIPQGDMKITSKGNRYKIGSFVNGGTCLLFPRDNDDCTVSWYAPTEKQIIDIDDTEIYDIYKDINSNNIKDYRMYHLNRTEVIRI